MTYDPKDVLVYIKVTRNDGVTYHQTIELDSYFKWCRENVKKLEIIRVATSRLQMERYVNSLNPVKKIRRRTLG